MEVARDRGAPGEILARRLQDWGWPLLDAQVENEHLLSLGAELWPRDDFLAQVASQTQVPERSGAWTSRFGTWPARQLADRST